MIYITGDKHGDYTDVFIFCNKYKTTKKDLLIILGDAGINYFLDDRDGKLSWCIEDNYQTRQLPENEKETIMQDTYRILMTRTTKNMFFYIPHNTKLDKTFEFLKDVGIEVWRERR